MDITERFSEMKPSEVFFDLVKTQFAPMLRADGFRGSGRTFRRNRSGCIHIVNLQTSMSGGRCAVNLAVNFDFLDGVNATKVMQEECDFRRRLSPTSGKTDFWWDFGDGSVTTQKSVLHLIETYKQAGASFFAHFGEFPGSYADITVDDLKTPSAAKLPGGTTDVRYALRFAQMWLHLQQPIRAKEFLLYGLEACGPMATGVRAQLKQLLNQIEAVHGEQSL